MRLDYKNLRLIKYMIAIPFILYWVLSFLFSEKFRDGVKLGLYIIGATDVVLIPATLCDETKQDEIYCRQVYRDDGYVRFSTRQPTKPNCCIFERYVLDQDKLSYRVKACDKQDLTKLNCLNKRQQGPVWFVDDRRLTIDYDWPEHFER